MNADKDFNDRAQDTVLWVGMGLAGVIVLVQVAAAEVAAAWLHNPEVASVLSVLAVALPLASVAGLQSAIFKRRLRFKALAIRGLAAAAVSGAVAAGLAVAGFGVWALVAQAITFQLTSVIALWVTDPWWPGRHWDADVARVAPSASARGPSAPSRSTPSRGPATFW